MRIIAESTNRHKLRQTTRKVAKDIMDVLRGDGFVLSQADLSKNAWDAGLVEGELVTGVLLGPYVWLPKIDVSDYGPEDELENYFSVSVGVSIDDQDDRINVTGLGWAYDRDGDVLPGIDVRIRLPVSFEELSGADISMVNREVMNTVAHELEHLTQKNEFKSFDRGDRYYEGIPTDLVGGEMFRYLMKPDEVAAHVIGYSSHTKSWSELVQDIESMVKNYQISGQLTKSEADQVMDAWLDWGARNLKQVKFSNR